MDEKLLIETVHSIINILPIDNEFINIDKLTNRIIDTINNGTLELSQMNSYLNAQNHITDDNNNKYVIQTISEINEKV